MCTRNSLKVGLCSLTVCSKNFRENSLSSIGGAVINFFFFFAILTNLYRDNGVLLLANHNQTVVKITDIQDQYLLGVTSLSVSHRLWKNGGPKTIIGEG